MAKPKQLFNVHRQRLDPATLTARQWLTMDRGVQAALLAKWGQPAVDSILSRK